MHLCSWYLPSYTTTVLGIAVNPTSLTRFNLTVRERVRSCLAEIKIIATTPQALSTVHCGKPTVIDSSHCFGGHKTTPGGVHARSAVGSGPVDDRYRI